MFIIMIDHAIARELHEQLACKYVAHFKGFAKNIINSEDRERQEKRQQFR
jgi:hypothetical protein